jgi:predicted amidohydrolase YtcJ
MWRGGQRGEVKLRWTQLITDLMLLNGNIYTMNPQLPRTEAVAMKDSKIVAVGKNSEVENLGRRDFKLINLEGKTVIPGLTDCHTHFLSFAHGLRRVNLHGIDSFDQILSTIKLFSEKLRPDEWLVGGGWDKNILGDESIFTRHILDEIRPGSPVALQSKDHHVLWINSKALGIVGISRFTGDPRGGKIERDPKTGEPVGILKEKACNLVWERIPSPSTEASKELLKEAQKIANSCGLTGIQNHDDPGAFELFQQLQSEGELTLRAAFWIPIQDMDSAITKGLNSGSGNEFVRFGGVKMYADGALGSQTALMFEPFEGSDNNLGIEATSQEELAVDSIKACRAGMGVAIHAIGDKAVHQSLNAIEKSNQQRKEETKLQHRIEHVQLLHPDDKQRFQKLGIIASVQPVHIPADIDIAERHWGKRSKFAYAFKSLIDSGARVVFGSDVPIETLNPWMGIHAAVTRHRLGEKKSWYPEQRVTVTDAVSAYTRWASYASYEENLKGSIQVGKLADMVILSQDILKIDPEEIPEIKVECTILGGKIVFEA